MKASGLIVGGKRVECSVPVYNMDDHGLSVKIGDGARRRHPKRVELDLFVWHWTGGEGNYRTLFKVLDTRELGVEFFIDDGSPAVYQFADPMLVDTFDAGAFNPRSVGCEIRNYGFRSTPLAAPAAGLRRETYKAELHGRTFTFAKFYPNQVKAAIALARAVSAAIPTIPLQVPCGLDGQLFKGTIPMSRMKAMRGHVGHFHLTERKMDPGFDLLQAFRDDGFRGVTVPT